jgi:hypothetical protein
VTWRDWFRPIIAEVIGVFAPGDDVGYVRKAVLASWPVEMLGEREHWPYAVWLDEVRRQLAAFTARQAGYPFARGRGRSTPADPRQLEFLA